MARVFISHASEDTDPAAEIRDWLETDGHKVFFDRDQHDGIKGGDPWKERLYEGLRWADVVVCLITRDYVRSQWCFGEVIAAKTLGSKILPLAVERGVDHPLLNSLQYVTYHGAQLQARERICGILREIDVVGGAGWPDDRSPFPGLRAFDVDMHRAFFGRHGEVDDLVRLLRSLIERGEKKVVVVVGPSGCGKSSLVRAGLIPAIGSEPGWATLSPVVPGTDPVAALSRELADATRSTPSQIRQWLDGENGLIDTVESFLYVGEPPLRRRLLIVIDQFEEMLTRSSVTTRARFAAMLQPAVAGPVHLVVTLRSEYLDSLLADTDLARLPIQSVTLRPLDTAVLPLVIEGPARLAGLGVDSELVSRMVADTGSGDALPLLAFTLEQLALDLPRGATLSSERYDRLGGVRGALIRQADLALADAIRVNARANNERNRTNVLDSLLRLVTVDERGQPTRLDVDYQQLPSQVRTELDAFVAHRLLTTRERDETVLLGVAHEAFLTAWPPLAEAITAAGAALRTRRMLEQAAAEWGQANRSASFLWGQGRVEAAMSEIGAQLRRVHRNRPQVEGITDRLRGLLGYREVTSGRIELGPAVRAFLQVSIRHQQRRRFMFFAAVTTALVIAFTITTIAIMQRQAAENEKISATVRGLVAQGEIRRASNPRLALKLDLAAHRIRSTVEADTSLYRALASSSLIATLPTGHTRLRMHEIRIPLGYNGGVAFSPDGRTLATTTSDEPTVGLWDMSDRTHSTRIATLTNGTGWVNSVAFSPDGHSLATTADNTVVLWDITDRTHPTKTATLTGHTNPVQVVAFSPDGHALATTSLDGTSGLWDITNRDHPTRIATLTGQTKWIYGVAFSPDGHALATTDENTAELWDITDRTHPTKTATLTGHTGLVHGVAFSPNGHILATASSDKTVRLWSVTDRTYPTNIATLTGHVSSINAVTFSPDGHTLATASSDHSAILWSLADLKQPISPNKILIGHTDVVDAVAFSPDGQTLATGSYDYTAGLWDLINWANPTRTATLSGHANSVYGVAFNPDGHTLVTISLDNTTGLWDLTDRSHPIRTTTLPGNPNSMSLATFSPVNGVTFSPDGRTLVTTMTSGGTFAEDAITKTTVGVWDITDRTKPVRTATLTDPFIAVAFSPDGHTLATISRDSKVAELWDITDRSRPARIATLAGHTNTVYSVAFSPDGHTLATTSLDKTAALWDVTDRSRPTRTATLTGHTDTVYGVAFSPDGNTLATTSDDNTAALWDVADRSHPTKTATLTGHLNTVRGVAFGPHGDILATTSDDGTAGLWDITDRTHPARIATLIGHTSAVTAAAFSPDGRTLATASRDGTAALWDLRGALELPGHLKDRSCTAAGGGLDQEEWDAFVPNIPYQPSC